LSPLVWYLGSTTTTSATFSSFPPSSHPAGPILNGYGRAHPPPHYRRAAQLGRTVEPVTRSSLTSTCTFAFRVYGLGFMLHSARLAQPPRGGRGSDCSGGGLEVLPVAGMAGLDSSMTCILPLRILLPLRPWSAGPQQKPGQGRRESGRVEARDGEKEGAFGLCAFVRVCARLCTFVSVSPPGPTTVTYH
jgi:hypothetical protein